MLPVTMTGTEPGQSAAVANGFASTRKPARAMNEISKSSGLPNAWSRFCLAIELAPYPSVALECPGSVVRYVNPSFSELIGATVDEILGRSLASLMSGVHGGIEIIERVSRSGLQESHHVRLGGDCVLESCSYTVQALAVDAGFQGVLVQVIAMSRAGEIERFNSPPS